MAYLIFKVSKIIDSYNRCICINSKTFIENIQPNHPYNEYLIGSFTVNNSCDNSYTFEGKDLYNQSGFRIYVKTTQITPNTNTEVSVYISGSYTKAQDLVVNYSESCISGERTISITLRPSGNLSECIEFTGNNQSVNIIRGSNVNQDLPQLLVFKNNCYNSITIPEQVFFNSDGLKIYVPSIVVPGYSTRNSKVKVLGNYTGSQNTLNTSISINGSQANVTVNVSEPDQPPVTNDVIVNLENRQNSEIRLSDLNWSDPELDEFQAVRFKGDTSKLFTNIERTQSYMSGTVITNPDFVIYFKAPDTDEQSTYTVEYDVKAGNKWSN